jgi:copper transport protein
MLFQRKIPHGFSFHVLIALGVALLGLVALPVRVAAHAQYDHSLPAANARLPSGHPPSMVQVWFTEQIEPAFSSLTVYNQAKQRVDAHNSHVVANDSFSMIVSLPPHLTDGAYTVVFENVSLDDGHHVGGAFSFVVGGDPLPSNTNTLLGNVEPTDEHVNGWSITIRWLNYLGMATLVGGLAFLLLVWRPTLVQLETSIGPELSMAKQRVNMRISHVLLWSLLVLAAGWVAMLLYQSSVDSGKTLWQLLSSDAWLRVLVASHFGAVWLLRLGLIVLAFLLWAYGRNRNEAGAAAPARWPWLLLLLLGSGMMVTTALASHAAANRDAWFLVPADVLHLVSTGCWIGGLLALVGIVPAGLQALVPGTGARTRLLARLLAHFSLIALVSVLLLVVTGTVQAVIQLGSVDAFLTSSYGRALALKSILFVLLLCLGAYHLLSVSPRMNAFAERTDEQEGAGSLAAGKLQRAFRRTVRTEAFLMVVLLLVVGGLTSLSPPPPGRVASSPGGPFIRQGQVASLSYQLVINPGKVGENTIEVVLSDTHGKPIQGADAVIVRLRMLEMEMGVQEADLHPVVKQPGHYATTDSSLSMAGQWQLTLLVRRRGFDEVNISWTSTFH